MSSIALVSIAAAVISVPLLLAASFFFLTLRLAGSSAEQRFVDDLAEQRRLALVLVAIGAVTGALSLVALVATRLA